MRHAGLSDPEPALMPRAVRARVHRTRSQLSFRLKRYCSIGVTTVTSAFNGISFPGSAVGNVTYFSLSPSYARQQFADSQRACAGGRLIGPLPPVASAP